MAHHPTNKPNLGAAQNPQLEKRHPRKPSSTSAAAAVYSLTNHLSRLHTTSNSKPQPQRLVDTHLQVKALSKSANYSEQPPSTQKTGKQGKRVVFESDNKGMQEKAKAKEKEMIVHASGGKVSKIERQNEAGAMKPTTRRTVERLSLGGGASIGTGRRRSFCDVQVELGNFLVTNCAKVVSVDMPPFMQIHAVGFARKTKDSLEKFTSKSLALSLKKEFDGVYGPAWHCIVGTSFGSFVTHSVGGFMYFAMDQKVYVLLFKTSVQRAD